VYPTQAEQWLAIVKNDMDFANNGECREQRYRAMSEKSQRWEEREERERMAGEKKNDCLSEMLRKLGLKP
jgi:hypothetical protein